MYRGPPRNSIYNDRFGAHLVSLCGVIKNTLPETSIFAPENGGLEYDRVLLGFGPIFRGVLLLVSGITLPQWAHLVWDDP